MLQGMGHSAWHCEAECHPLRGRPGPRSQPVRAYALDTPFDWSIFKWAAMCPCNVIDLSDAVVTEPAPACRSLVALPARRTQDIQLVHERRVGLDKTVNITRQPHRLILGHDKDPCMMLLHLPR